VAFLKSLDSHGGVARRKILTFELENLLAGIDTGLAAGEWEAAAGCALAAGEVFRVNGPLSDGVLHIKRCLEKPVGHATQERLLRKVSWMMYRTGHPSEALDHFQQALEVAREMGCRRSEGMNLGNLGWHHQSQGRIPEALDHFQQALAIAREVGNRRSEGINLGNLGWHHQSQGRIPEALDHFQQALAIAREVGNRRNEGMNLGNLGSLHHAQGRIAEAQDHFQQALVISREVDNRRNEGMNLGNLAELHRHEGRIPEAQDHYHQALVIAREMGNRRNEGLNLGNLGDLLFSQGDLLSASTHLREAIEICDESMPVGAGAFRGSLALICAQQGAFDEARILLDMGEPQLRGVYQLELGKLLCKKARVEHVAGDPAAAAAALTEAQVIATELDAGPGSGLGEAIAETRAALSGSDA
jgi:tetratricopeptide (TPR) repeat protein